jgi:hypothetical protein
MGSKRRGELEKIAPDVRKDSARTLGSAHGETARGAPQIRAIRGR